jgi:hypothetical protein
VSNLSWWYLLFWCLFVNVSAVTLYISFQDLSLLYNAPSDFFMLVSDNSWKRAFVIFGIINIIYLFDCSSRVICKMVLASRNTSVNSNFGFILFLIGSSISITNSLLLLPKIRSEYYSIVYSGSIKDVIPFMWFWNLFYTFGIFLVLSNWREKKSKLFYVIIIAVGLIGSLHGARTFLIISCLFVLWHYSMHTSMNFKNKIFIPLFLFLLISVFLSSVRSGEVLTMKVLLSSFNYFSTSVKHVIYFLELEDDLDYKFPFLFSNFAFIYQYLIHGGLIIGQTLYTAEFRFDLNHKLSSLVNIDSYLSGSGMGTFYISEALQYGGIFAILVAMYAPKIVYWVQIRILRNSLFRGFSFLFFGWAIIMPRSTILPDIWYIVKVLVLLFLYRAILSLFNLHKVGH